MIGQEPRGTRRVAQPAAVELEGAWPTVDVTMDVFEYETDILHRVINIFITMERQLGCRTCT